MNVKDRVELTVKLVGVGEYETHFGYSTTCMRVYTLKDENGEVFIWKTSSILGFDTEGGWCGVERGDIARIKGTVKGFTEYKGVPQTELTRVKALEIVHREPTQEEKDEARRAEQMETIGEGDFIWTMPYKQYKEHYADCETLAGSFQRYVDPDGYTLKPPTIDVIIRAGRLKNSGVRGKRFYSFGIRFNENGSDRYTTYKAICEENAIRRAMKEFPEGKDFKCTEIY